MPSNAEAGPLLDWLFQRNRASAYSRGYSGSPYAAGYAGTGTYGNAPASAYGYGANYSGNYDPSLAAGNQFGPGQNNLGQNTLAPGNGGVFRGQNNSTLFPKCCLFGRGRGYASNTNPANNLAGANADPRTTAGYGGSCETGCQAGWCQQTVLRYVPQIAYRTAYQPVPVTTYKTSTSINPANGLPRTCTRPCTSYSYQARRVPYTTYRPVYTTVPVADDCGCNQQQQAGYAPYPAPNFAGQAPQLAGYGANPPCTSCQNGGWSTPGYTPGDATVLPTAPSEQVGPWRPLSQSGNSGFGSGGYGDVSGATPWRPLRGNYTETPASSSADSYGDIPWRPLQSRGGDAEADRRPTLRPDTSGFADDGYTQSRSYADDFQSYDDPARSGSSGLRAVPAPGEFEENRPRSELQLDPTQRIDGAQANYRPPMQRSFVDDPRFGYGPTYGKQGLDNRASETQHQGQGFGGRESSQDYFDDQPIDGRMFTTPRQMSNTQYGNPMEVNETRRPNSAPYQSRPIQGIRDLDRGRRPYASDDDKTAQDVSPSAPNSQPGRDFVQTKPRGSRPMLDDEANAVRSSRFASMPIDWSAVSRTREVKTQTGSSDWQVR